MSPFELAASLVVLAATFSYLNYKFLKLPPAIGLMALSLAGSLLLILIGMAAPRVVREAKTAVAAIDLNQTFLHGMLGFMLFAGSLHINFNELAARKWSVSVLSTVGVVISTIVVGLLTWVLLNTLGLPARFVYCLLFGALISPTDPIAILAILRQAGVPKELETTIAGESLFNDGVGVVAFLGILEIATGKDGGGTGYIAEAFLQEAVGGAAFGLAIGWMVYRLLRSVDNYQVEVLLSLALVAGGYALADRLHVSGPIAMVVAGILIGNIGRSNAMSSITVESLDTFWELIDEVMNAVLFVLIGLVFLVLPFSATQVLVGLLAIPIVLIARLISVAIPITLIRRWSPFRKYTIRLLTWGGLRGGISVALALSIPGEVDGIPVLEKDALITLTYVTVVFSILVQGLSVGPLARHWLGSSNVPLPTPQS